MALTAGTRLGPYEILVPIGAGGMGEVYRARDTTLKRDVALKVLPATFLRDPERMARFQREAEVLASLDHPNIGQIYGIVDSEDSRGLVLALIEGPTLADRIEAGPLTLDEAVAISKQIIDALEYAHDRGVVHRDLKPANVKITSDGVVKVLDFGLAKVLEDEPPLSLPATSPTLTLRHTRAGVILGTAAYMSPEQAVGRPVDRRSDIFSFGALLYELLSGQRAFAGATTPDVLEAVVKSDPDWSALPAWTPGYLRKLLERTLVKDRKERLQAIGEARIALSKQKSDEPSIGAPAPEPPLSRFGKLWPGIAAAFALLAATVSFIHFREKPPAAEMVRFEISAPANTTLGEFPTVSPDGRKLAFMATGADGKPTIWIRPVDAPEARSLAGTEGAALGLFWSPDSRLLGFSSGGKLKKIEATGGPVQTLCDAPTFFGGAWTSDNRILFSTIGTLQQVPAAGGMPTPLTVPDHSRQEVGHFYPSMLPDGHHFFYFRVSVPFEKGGLYIGSLDAKPEQQSTKRLLPDGTSAVYAPAQLSDGGAGHLLFVRGVTAASETGGLGTLMAQPFDPQRMEFAGDAVPIAEQVNNASGFSASSTGVLFYRTGGAQGASQLSWYDRNGNVLSNAGEAGEYRDLALSPDAKQIAYVRGNDLWLFEFARGVNTKFTFGNPSQTPVWSADGNRIAFSSLRGGVWDIYQKASNLAGQEEMLQQSPETKAMASLTRDGRFLMYSALSADGKQRDLWILPMSGSAADRKPIPFLRTEFEEVGGRFSPDGRWVAYQSNESGKNEIYVRPFDASNPASQAAGGLRSVSKDGGIDAHWSADGKELFYLAPDGSMMSVAVSGSGAAFQSGVPQRLFKSPGAGRGSWDVAADGKRFLIAAPPAAGGAAAPAPHPYQVVLNWTELLKRSAQ
jgi:serine/threonine protein kinase/Tol biopolymer transport system component